MDTNVISGIAQSSTSPVALSTASLAAPKVAAPQGATDAVSPKALSRKELEEAVKNINEAAQSSRRNLDFSIDDATGETVVKVIATESGEVIRQIPSEVALRLAESFKESNSLLLNEKI
ncbi:flagellar protein FlaG [Pseudomonas sp. LTJR-52]|uniref:flagellar protein FlaG n=1 Tax=Pseudomonas sp. LTJR-52 TaxID=2479392 RepID=UPI000EFA46B0|nr:flagellar protein FlaG [Pseudomonas sp. LTJR-52]AYN94974.1 flagellar protein FlaG [Pseudomonas sp. LTJR-52]